MTAVAARPPVTDSSGGRPQGGVVRRRRSSRLVLLGVVLGVAGALAGLLVYREAGRRIEVIAIARTVPFGQALVVEDLRAATLPTDSGLAAMPWTAVDGVVGRTAGTDLLPGQILTAAAVANAAPPAAGEALIGVAVKPGQLPGAGLSPRDEVLVVPTTATPSGTRSGATPVGVWSRSGRRCCGPVRSTPRGSARSICWSRRRPRPRWRVWRRRVRSPWCWWRGGSDADQLPVREGQPRRDHHGAGAGVAVAGAGGRGGGRPDGRGHARRGGRRRGPGHPHGPGPRGRRAADRGGGGAARAARPTRSALPATAGRGGQPGPRRGGAVGPLGAELARLPGRHVLADCGRYVPGNGIVELLRRSHLVVLVLRSGLPAVRAAARLVPLLDGELDAAGGPPVVGMLIDPGRPYGVVEIEQACGLSIVGALPADPRTARVWSDGHPAGRMFTRSPLQRAAAELATDVLDAAADPSQGSSAATPRPVAAADRAAARPAGQRMRGAT